MSDKLFDRYIKVRNETINLCKTLETEDYVVQPITDVSPPKWHLAHTSWFFEVFILEKYLSGYKPFHQQYNYLFNSYYESAGERVVRTDRGNLSRPSVGEIYKYREYIDRHIGELFQGNEAPAEAWDLLELGIHHENQHQELLLTDIKYILGNNPLFPVYREEEKFVLDDSGHSTGYYEIPGGIQKIGHDSDDFCYDNEKGLHQVYLHPYRIMDRPVTNGEYLEFIKDGGYNDFRWWLSDGWEWVRQNGITAPMYWHLIDGKWYYFTLRGLRELDLNAPVTHVSYYEADAYAGWRNKRLPTEQEWEVAARIYPQIVNNLLENYNFMPVPNKDSNHFIGNVWEWTCSAYLPYPYYEKPPGAIGEYNGKFMVNQMVLRGGSCVTPQDHIRLTYRNFFQTDKRWQFTGIRLAESVK